MWLESNSHNKLLARQYRVGCTFMIGRLAEVANTVQVSTPTYMNISRWNNSYSLNKSLEEICVYVSFLLDCLLLKDFREP